MKILIFSGSPRKNSNSQKVAETAFHFFKSRGIDVLLYDLSAHVLPIFNGEEETFAHPEVKHLQKIAEQADGFFFCTPEYHNGISGALKNALDFLNRSHFDQKPVSLTAISGGGKGGINALNNLRLVIRGVGGLVLPGQCVVDKTDLDDTGAVHEAVKERLASVTEELIHYTALLQKKQSTATD
ncbi:MULTISPECIES: NADPH-dependent FMN reductase [Thermoactinomyces]|jgi:azobenzene reductase|uniref:NAD(P)H-dependent oxidoreductase n=1 Tax=Thermoactinomyces daqus TaxID=1329516 RepID=A0A7W2AIB0_9BACL|nr:MULTISPECIES: NADPH-dependent FMN reductase [Thermoactinomyces]MBA4543075.1 NAD(P)H-dependent oxidoreductase [Thermoactinomyces daqus]MBH8596690.1 NAD(P)H-dependent oxidoreductase [Thermoactinomyces sp. CICC 10523]MBH8603452.1 NAD(P)H-dependent oxidoreductase [Thermoactinomyces sp. CICC 10522]MBH8606617.1 NAD(P)H-dependent oxidoreductase [Thermoactinomyces sp. CICC 10521]